MTEKEPISVFMFGMIKKVLQSGCLKEPFSTSDVNRCCTTLMHSPSYLSSHAVGNTTKKPAYFIRVSSGKYKINPEYA